MTAVRDALPTAPPTAQPTADEILRRIAARVAPTLAPDALDSTVLPPFGDHALNDWTVSPEMLGAARAAAVLVGLVAHGDTLDLLLTRRTAGLRTHGGQIAFPGGRMDPGDAGPAATALREAEEEIGLDPARVTVLGYLDAYLSRTGYRIIPVVARIDPPFTLTLNPDEVVDSFEVPFALLMEEASYALKTREWMGAPRFFYAIDHGERTIWGVTAGILRVLHDRLRDDGLRP